MIFYQEILNHVIPTWNNKVLRWKFVSALMEETSLFIKITINSTLHLWEPWNRCSNYFSRSNYSADILIGDLLTFHATLCGLMICLKLQHLSMTEVIGNKITFIKLWKAVTAVLTMNNQCGILSFILAVILTNYHFTKGQGECNYSDNSLF